MLSEDHDVLLYEKDSLALLFPSLADRGSLHAFPVRSASQCIDTFGHHLEKPSLQSLLRCQCITEAQDDGQPLFCPHGVCSVASPRRLPSLPESPPSSPVPSSSPGRSFLKQSGGKISREMDELHSPLSSQSCTSPSPRSDPLACPTQAHFFCMSPSPLPSRSYRALAAYVGPVIAEPPASSLPLVSRCHTFVERSYESRRVDREGQETRQGKRGQASDPSRRRRIFLSHEFRLRSLRVPAEIAEKFLLPHPDTRAIVDLSRKRNVHHPLHPLVQLYLHLVETEARQGGPEGPMVLGALPVSARTESEDHSGKGTSSCVQRIFEEAELTWREEDLSLQDDRYWGRSHSGVVTDSNADSGGYRKSWGAEDSTAFLRWNGVRKPLTGGNREEAVEYWDSTIHGRKWQSVQRVSDRDRGVSFSNTGYPSFLGGVPLSANWERGIRDDAKEERLLVVAQAWAEKRKQDLFVDLVDIDLILKDMRVSGESDISWRTVSHNPVYLSVYRL